MSSREQSLLAMRRARQIVAAKLRRNISTHNPGMSPEALDTLVEEETTRALAPEAEEPEAADVIDWEAADSGWKPRERSPQLPPK